MTVRANTRLLSAVVAVLVLLHPFIRLACSTTPSIPPASVSLQLASDHSQFDVDGSISCDDRPTDSATPARRARINVDTVRDYMAALRAPSTLLARLVDPHRERFDEGQLAFVTREIFAAPMHETRGKPLTSDSGIVSTI